ncbi:MAG TPA: hypothetical protein VN777_03890 [Terriglobales bacterium]|nr:hypothetical protein [Terriglobales bacterium]
MKLKSLALSVGFAVLACMSMSAQTAFNFQTINFPHDSFTQLLGINQKGVIAGYHNVTANKGFTLRLSTHKFTIENYPGSAMTQVIGIDGLGGTCGFYVDQAGVTHGFLDSNDAFSTVDFPGTPFNQLLGRNDSAQAAGYYSQTANGTGPFVPYVYDINGGVFEVITIPGSVSAQATDINFLQQVTGFFIDSNNVSHGWWLNAGTLLQLDYPGASNTQATGENNKGIVVGTYQDSAGASHGFLYNTNTAKYTSVDAPNGTGITFVNGINEQNQLVGFTMPSSTTASGFVATPKK